MKLRIGGFCSIRKKLSGTAAATSSIKAKTLWENGRGFCVSSKMAVCPPKETPTPWIGMDIGAALTKLVYFEPCEKGVSTLGLGTIERYIKESKSSARKDDRLELEFSIGRRHGRLHFIMFASTELKNFLTLAKGITSETEILCATGGGAVQYEEDIRRELKVDLRTLDECEALVRGIHFIESCNVSKECYYLDKTLTEGRSTRIPYEFGNAYPYLVVNLGSGVSILSIHSPTDYKRVTGSSIGGGTFLGLACLLTGCGTYEEAIHLAERGDSFKVDRLVRDIYGGDCKRFRLAGNVVASTFGNMSYPEKRKAVSKEDLAAASLVMVANNIAEIACMCAHNQGVEKVLFAGNLLRVNPISMRMLSAAMLFWSDGRQKAIFLEHEGYFGAAGCLTELLKVQE